MSEIKKPFQWPVTIYYEDTDAGKIVYHANYLKFFERARTELLRAIGVSQQILLELNIGFVVSRIEIDYQRPARLDEQLMVVTDIVECRKASIVFCQKMVNSKDQILCKAIVKVACVDHMKMKPIAMPQFIFTELTKREC